MSLLRQLVSAQGGTPAEEDMPKLGTSWLSDYLTLARKQDEEFAEMFEPEETGDYAQMEGGYA